MIITCYTAGHAPWDRRPLPLQPPPALTRRRLGAGALFASSAIVLRRAKAARSVTLMAFGGWFQTYFDRVIVEAFRKAHPDIGVFYYPVGNSFQMLGVLREQRFLPSTDVVLLETGVAAKATAEDLLGPLSPEAMPVLKDLIPQAAVPGVAGPALVLDSLAMGYNPAQVAQAPWSWRNLWDPAYGRRIALQTPPDTAALALTVVAGALFGGSDLQRSLSVGINALTQLAPRVVSWDPLPDIYTAIAVGDAGIGPGWNARAQHQAALTPSRFAANIPDEGSPVRIITVNLVKGSPQPEAARILLAWLLGPQAQRLLTETMFFAPMNARADIAPASLARVGATPAMAARRMAMDWVAVDGIRDQITAEWRRRKLAGHQS
jgi:putative spermidine/putrescine transport system substrate-binding protein